MKKILLVMCVLSCLAWAADGGDKKPEGARGEKGARPDRGQMLVKLQSEYEEIKALYDKDKDGKLSVEERVAMEKELDIQTLENKMKKARSLAMFKKVDTDGDGALSEAEINAARKKMEKRKPQNDGEGQQRRRRNGGDVPKARHAEE